MDETDINLPNQLKNFLNQFLRIMGTLIIVTYTFPSIIFIIIPLAIGKNTQKVLISSGTDEDRAKREPNLCNESVNGHFWSNLYLNCIFKWTWFVKTDIWSVIDGSRVRFPPVAAFFFLFSPIFISFLTRFHFCSTRISKVGKCAAFQLWTLTYSSLLEYRAPSYRVVNLSPIWQKMASMALLYFLYAQL